MLLYMYRLMKTLSKFRCKITPTPKNEGKEANSKVSIILNYEEVKSPKNSAFGAKISYRGHALADLPFI
jgi:ABC-type transport system involved in Fe-S cluster assembly fused permease/ATPase subunit